MKERFNKVVCKLRGHLYLYSFKAFHSDNTLYIHKVCHRCWHEEVVESE